MNKLQRRKIEFCLLIVLFSLIFAQSAWAEMGSGTSGDCQWVIDNSGVLTIQPSNGSSCTLSDRDSLSWEWNMYRSQIKGVHVYPESAGAVSFSTNAAYAFADFTNCSDWYGLAYINASGVQNASYMFRNCAKLTDASALKNWTISGATNIAGMFSGCSGLTSLDLSGWNVTAVTSLAEVFKGCSGLTSLNLSGTGWNIAAVTDMSNAFDSVPSGLALDTDYYFPQKYSGYPKNPYIYDKHSYADFTNAPASAPSGWVFEPYAVTVTFTGAGKDTGVITKDSNVMTNAEAYFNAVQVFNSGTNPYDSSAIYYQKGADSTLQFSSNEPTHYTVSTVTKDGSAETLASQYSITDIAADHTYSVEIGKATYTLTYLDGGADSGAVPTPAADTPWDDEVTVLGNTGSLTKTGYDFAGWSDGTNVYQEGDKFNMPDQAVNLTAQYTVHTYTLYYNAGSGTGTTPAYAYVPFGTVVTLPLATETDYALTGNTMTGWLDAANQHYDLGGTLTMPAGDMTLSAEFTPNQYTLTYAAGEGTGSVPAAVTVDYGTWVTVEAGTGLTKTGYSFEKWNDGQDDWAPGATFTMPAYDLTLTAQYKINNYTLTYEAGAGSGTIAPETVEYNSWVTVKDSSALTNTGYTFTNWTDSDGNSWTPGTKFTMPAYDLTLTAQYAINSYTLTYDLQGAEDPTGTIPAVTTYEYQQSVDVADGSSLVKTGYTFANWLDLGGNPVNPGTAVFTMPAGNLTLKASFTQTPYTVTYEAPDAESGSVPVDSTTYYYEDAVTVLGNTGSLTKNGYTFTGWSDGTTTYPADGTGTFNMPAQNVTLTAQFKANTYTLYYNAGSGTGTTPTSASVDFGTVVTLPLASETDYALTGNTMTGWLDAANQHYDLGGTLTMPAGDMTLSAEFTPNQYTLTYAAGEGAGDVPAAQSITYGTWVTVEDGSNLTKKGHSFSKWNDGQDDWNPGATFTMPAYDLTMTAQFTPNDYTLTYDAGTGTGTIAPETKTYDTWVTVADGTGFTKTGYSFAYWTDADGNIWNPGMQFTMPDSAVTLTAQYTINSYTLTYDAGTGTGTIDPETVVYDTEVTANDGSSLSKTGYTFSHWEDSDSMQYLPNTTFNMPDKDLTLTAQYNINAYTVHYEAPDAVVGTGTLPADEMKDYNEAVIVADDCGLTKVGHTLTGWKSSYDETVYLADGTATFTMPALPNNNDTLTLTAVFTPNPHTLTYTKGSGTGDDQTETVAYGTTINLSLGSGFSKTGYGLTGWTDGTNSYNAGAAFTMPDSDVTLEAVYTLGSYTVYYDINGATGTAPTSTAVAYQTVVTVADDSTFSKEGCTFVNWLDEDGNSYAAGDTFPMPDKDMILTAQYSTNSYTLSYDAGDGTGTLPAAETLAYGTVVTVGDGSGLIANNTGWSFANWTDGTNTYQAGDTFTMPAQNVTLTAVYTPNVHTLTYTASEVTSPTLPDPAQVSFGTVVTAADGSGLALTGYIFVYWTDGTNKYASGQTFTMPDEDVTLEAIFAEKEYEVVFTIGSAQSGTAPDTVQYTLNDDGTISFVLPENTGELAKAGCTFAGWKDVDNGTIYQPGDVYTLNLASKGLLTIITIHFEPVFTKNNKEMNFFALPGAYEYDLPAAFENVTAMPGTGFSALRPTVLREQPASLAYHTTALELMLPSQDVNAAVQVIPMENGSWAVEWLGSTAGMLEGSAMPGEGPCFIAAHNHLNTTEAGPFWALSSLDVNDRVFVRDANSGDMQTFSVYESVQYGPNDFAEMAAKAYSEEAGLVLITCEDESADSGYLHRRVVFAK